MSNKKKYEDKTLSKIEKDQLKESPKREDVREDEAQDLYPDEFTEDASSPAYGSETKGSEEIEDSLADERFSKSHEADESELRKTKKMRLEQDVDSLSDE